MNRFRKKKLNQTHTRVLFCAPNLSKLTSSSSRKIHARGGKTFESTPAKEEREPGSNGKRLPTTGDQPTVCGVAVLYGDVQYFDRVFTLFLSLVWSACSLLRLSRGGKPVWLLSFLMLSVEFGFGKWEKPLVVKIELRKRDRRWTDRNRRKSCKCGCNNAMYLI